MAPQNCISDDSKKRHGTEQDVESLKALLKEIGLEVKDEDLYTDYDDASALTVTKYLIIIKISIFHSYFC